MLFKTLNKAKMTLISLFVKSKKLKLKQLFL